MACIRRALQRADIRAAQQMKSDYCAVAELGSGAHAEDKTDTNPKLSSRDALNTLLIASNPLQSTGHIILSLIKLGICN
jgi:hypothetical protein